MIWPILVDLELRQVLQAQIFVRYNLFTVLLNKESFSGTKTMMLMIIIISRHHKLMRKYHNYMFVMI